MTLSVRAELSHRFSYDSKIDATFKLTLVSEKRSEAKGFHHIILIDCSRSMAGEKIELAKRGAREYAKRIPPGNTLSVILFSTAVQTFPNTNLEAVLPQIRAQGLTALNTALQSAFDIAKKSNLPGWIVLLTDGEPTDVVQPDAYAKMKPPNGFQMVEFGIGTDYNQHILKVLADSSGGTLSNVTEAQKFTLPEQMQQSTVSEVGARNIKVDFENNSVKILNYKGPPVSINAIESIVKIWGKVQIPAGFKGRIMNAKVSYEDPVEGKKRTIDLPVEVGSAENDEQFQEGIDNNLVSEFAYYQGLEDYYAKLSSGQLKEATKTINQLSSNAEQTRRTDLIEATKKLSEQHEQTLKLGGSPEATSKLLKEVASETTKRTRGK